MNTSDAKEYLARREIPQLFEVRAGARFETYKLGMFRAQGEYTKIHVPCIARCMTVTVKILPLRYLTVDGGADHVG